jgi:hypothetical protein
MSYPQELFVIVGDQEERGVINATGGGLIPLRARQEEILF